MTIKILQMIKTRAMDYDGLSKKDAQEIRKRFAPEFRKEKIDTILRFFGDLWIEGKANEPNSERKRLADLLFVSDSQITSIIGRDGNALVRGRAAVVAKTLLNPKNVKPIPGDIYRSALDMPALIRALEKSGNKRAVPIIINMHRNPKNPARDNAAQALGRMKEKRAVPALIKTLGETFYPDSFELRTEAAKALGKIGDRSAGPALLKAFRKNVYKYSYRKNKCGRSYRVRVVDDLHYLVKNAAAVALAEVGYRPAIPYLIEASVREPYLEDADAYVKLIDKQAIPFLIKATESKYNKVRERAVLAFSDLLGSKKYRGKINDKRVVDALVKRLNDSHANVRWRAALALMWLEDKRAVPALNKRLRDNNPRVKLFVILALASIKDKRAVFPLIKFIKARTSKYYYVMKRVGCSMRRSNVRRKRISYVNPNWLRLRATARLGVFQDNRAAPFLLKTLHNDGSSQVRAAAAYALGVLMYKPAISALRKARAGDSSNEVKTEAAKALWKLGDRK